MLPCKAAGGNASTFSSPGQLMQVARDPVLCNSLYALTATTRRAL